MLIFANGSIQFVGEFDSRVIEKVSTTGVMNEKSHPKLDLPIENGPLFVPCCVAIKLSLTPRHRWTGNPTSMVDFGNLYAPCDSHSTDEALSWTLRAILRPSSRSCLVRAARFLFEKSP